jgi:hypothetical protein
MAVGKKPVLGGKDAVKVAIVQKAPRFLDKEDSLTRAETYIAEAAEPSSSFFRRYGSRGIRIGQKVGTPRSSPGSEAVSPSAMRLSSRPVRTPSGWVWPPGAPTHTS